MGVSRLLDTNVKGTPVVLYNALGFAVNDLAEIEVEFAKAPKGIAVYNAEEEGGFTVSGLSGR